MSIFKGQLSKVDIDFEEKPTILSSSMIIHNLVMFNVHRKENQIKFCLNQRQIIDLYPFIGILKRDFSLHVYEIFSQGFTLRKIYEFEELLYSITSHDGELSQEHRKVFGCGKDIFVCNSDYGTLYSIDKNFELTKHEKIQGIYKVFENTILCSSSTSGEHFLLIPAISSYQIIRIDSTQLPKRVLYDNEFIYMKTEGDNNHFDYEAMIFLDEFRVFSRTSPKITAWYMAHLRRDVVLKGAHFSIIRKNQNQYLFAYDNCQDLMIPKDNNVIIRTISDFEITNDERLLLICENDQWILYEVQ